MGGEDVSEDAKRARGFAYQALDLVVIQRRHGGLWRSRRRRRLDRSRDCTTVQVGVSGSSGSSGSGTAGGAG